MPYVNNTIILLLYYERTLFAKCKIHIFEKLSYFTNSTNITNKCQIITNILLFAVVKSQKIDFTLECKIIKYVFF